MTVPSDFPRPAVALVMVSWNSWRHTIECLDSVLGQAWPNFHVFIVDNASADGSVEQIAAWCARPRAEADWARHKGVERYTDRAEPTPIGTRVLDRPEGVVPLAAPDC